MMMLESVFGSLKSMTSLQLLCGFLALIGYAALQGRLIEGGVRWLAGTLALLAAFGFVLAGDDWVYGFMLLAFAIAGLGMFAGLVWVLGNLLGFHQDGPPQVLDSTFVEPSAEPRPVATAAPAAPVSLGSPPMAASKWTAPSH